MSGLYTNQQSSRLVDVPSDLKPLAESAAALESGSAVVGESILILGGGTGGVVAANALRNRLSRDHRIVVVEREPSFALAASFLWVMTGDRTPSQVSRPLERLQRKGIEVVRGEVERIDSERREAVVDGRPLCGGRLIVTLGAEFALTPRPTWRRRARPSNTTRRRVRRRR